MNAWRTKEELTNMPIEELKAYVSQLRQAVGNASKDISSNEDKDSAMWDHDPLHKDEVTAMQTSYKTALKAVGELREPINDLIAAVGTRSQIVKMPELSDVDAVGSYLRGVGENLDAYLKTLNR